MDKREFIENIAANPYIRANSDEHSFMHEASSEARKITAQINCGFHSAGELRQLFSALTEENIDDGFNLFPPFYTDFGKNIKIGQGVFINSGCFFLSRPRRN